VLGAAVACILENGYYQTSSNEIARRAGVTWGTLQYQFGTRDSLLIEVLNDRWELLEHAVAEADIIGETLEDRLGEVLAVLSRYYGQPEHLAQLQILLDLTHNPKTSVETRKAVAAHGRELTRAWKPLFARALGDAAGEEDLVRYAFTTLRGYLVGYVISSSIADVQSDRMSRLLLVRGVAAAVRAEAAERGIAVEQRGGLMIPVLPYGGEVERIGDLEVVPVFDGYSREDPTHFYAVHPDAPPQRGDAREDWAEHTDFLDADGLVEHGLGGFLVRTGEHVVLIDTGVGPNQIGPYGPYNRGSPVLNCPRLASSASASRDHRRAHRTCVRPLRLGAENDASLFQARRSGAAFDWDHFVVKPGDAISPFSRSLLALEDRLVTWDSDGPVLPGIDAQLAPGHTPGSTILVLSSGTSRGVLLGDVVHCPVELVEDEWASLGDVDPALARRTKIALARELEGTDTPVAGPHFPGMRFGRLLAGDGRRSWVL
jgi:AcrR family transcriptional regulator